MRRLLDRIGVRGGVTLGLILLVAAVVAIGRLVGGPTNPPAYEGRPEPSATVTAGPTAADDGAVEVTPSSFADDAAVRSAVAAFMAAWLQRGLSPEAWHAAIAPLSTRTLAQSLAGVDPTGVPATRIVGEPTVTRRSEIYAQVSVPVDSGTVQLTVLKMGNSWLVDGVDWERA